MVTAGPDGGEDGPADATVLRMLLGAQLRRFREAAGVTPEAAGYEIRASVSKISRRPLPRPAPGRRAVPPGGQRTQQAGATPAATVGFIEQAARDL